MKKILITIYFLSSLFVFGYEPLVPTENLYLRDIPIFYGLENTKKRLESNNNEPIWALNLSGGSARAFAHIGVLKRLEEEGLRPDVIITNSMGSIVGLTYAAGMSVADIEDLLKAVKLSEFFDLIFPFKGGLINVHRFEAFMFALFGKMDLSEAAIPVFVVTEDLRSKQLVILSEGDLVEILMASFALPVYFEPVNIDNFRLIDGGTTSFIPIREFDDLFPNMVVSSTFNGVKVNLYNPLSILNVTFDIIKSRNSVRQIKEFNPFLIRCNVEKISFMAFDEGEKIISIGYESCNDVIPELKEYLENKGIYPSKTVLKEFEQTKKIHDNWQNLESNINNTILPVREMGWSINPGFEFWQSFRNLHYLNQNIFPIVRTSIWYNRTLLEGILFYSNDLTGPIIRMESGYNSLLYMNFEGQFLFSTLNDSVFQYQGNYFFSDAGVILTLPFGFIKPAITAEFIDIETKFDYYLRPGVIFESGSSNLMLDLRYLFRRDSENEIRGISAEYLLSVPIGDNFSLDTRAYGKGAVSNISTGVELTFNDYYRSSGSSIFSALHDYFPSYIILNNNIIWNIGKYLPPLGELITLKESTLYLFCDLLVTDLFNYSENTEVNPTVGLGVNLETSFIGLKPFTFILSGGWDLDAVSPFIAFSVGTVFK